MDMLQ